MAESIMAKPEQINVMLIRSGASEWDRCGRLVGQADLPICKSSRNEVDESSAMLNGAELRVILHAADQCSTATASAYAQVTGAKTKVVEELADVDLGLWEGLRTEELEEKFPKAYREWRDNPANVIVPEGETLVGAGARITGGLAKALDKLRAPDPGVGVVLRPMAYGLVRCWLTGRPISELWKAMDGPAAEWHEVTRSQLRQAREESRVGS
ncbi:MAG TPA: histidine phosphatase family protein [Phycisphaerales bacterium]|nr:histidine phosphatase family protein [Phycisphaerales bacterium]